ncbi:alkaline shock response membrane anchor protein AmaP [Actinomadura sp. NPDC047616]|uniref:alkaline shock response membrane anchor protein AmaP n=1 Tax=Actinomadura sp. NPDC047616 TaxID=3155914 RepID=UPI0033DABA93
MTRRTGRTNRLGLALLGLILTAVGGTALARALDLSPRLLGEGHGLVLGEPTRRVAADHWWFWPALAVAAAVIALLALGWLAAQTRTQTVRHVSLEPDPRHGATHLPAQAATHALEDDLTSSPQIHRAHATLTGAPTTPQLTLVVTLRTDTDLTDARLRIQHAVARLRSALETDHLPATIQIRSLPPHR